MSFRAFLWILAAALLCLVGLQDPATAAVTGKVAGRVVDAQGKPLPGANVVLVGTRRGAVSDADGFYTILLVEPGIYEMEASLIGYQKVRQKEVKVLVDYTTTVHFRLREAAVEAGEVVVTAERPAVEPDKTASKFYVTAKDIEMMPVVKSVQSFAGLQPGVQHDGLSMRMSSFEVAGGVTAPYPAGITYAVDGVRMVNDDSQGKNMFVGVNRSSVQEISVLTGVPEAEYGNMDAGVINVVTKQGGQDFHGFLEYRYTKRGQRHFGFNAYDPRAHINTATGKSRLRLDDLDWLNEKDPDTGRLVHVQPDDYTKVDGHRVEASLSGPVGPRASFHVSYLTDEQPQQGQTPEIRELFLAQPAAQRVGPALRDPFNYQLTGKLAFTITPQVNLKLGGVFGRAQEFLVGNDAALGDGRNIFLPAWKSGAGKQIVKNWMGYGVLTHSLSPRTLYEVRFSRSETRRDTSGVPEETMGAPRRDKDGWFTVERRVRGFRVERETRHNLKVDFSSQVTKGNFLKAGVDATWYRTWLWSETSKGNPGEFTLDLLYDYPKAAANRFGKDGKMDFAPIKAGSKSNAPDLSAASNLDDPAWTGYRDFPRHAFQLSAYVQDKMEFEGMVVNAGVRFDGFLHRGQFRPELMWSGLPAFRFLPDAEAGLYRNAQNPYPKDPTAYPTWGGKNIYRFSPRFGVSHPITDRSAAHFSYGRFMVLPIFYTMYGWGWQTASGQKQHVDLNGDGRLSSYEYMAGLESGPGSQGTATPMGNPGMLGPTAVNYEAGMDWNFVSDYTATVTMFYRRSERYAHNSGGIFRDPALRSDAWALVYVNLYNAETRGLELGVSKRLSHYFSFRATYSWYWNQNTTYASGFEGGFYPDANFIAGGAYRYKFDIDKTTGERVYQPLTQAEIASFGQVADSQIEQELTQRETYQGRGVRPSQKFKDRRPYEEVGLPILKDEKNIAVRGIAGGGGGVRGPASQRETPSDGSFTALVATPPGFGPGFKGFHPLADLNLNLVLRVEPGTFFKFVSPTPSPSTNGKLISTALVFRNPTWFGTDLGVEKGFRAGKLRPVVFFEATNLFNAKKPAPISRWATFSEVPQYGFAQNQPTPEVLRRGTVVWDQWNSYQNRTRELYFGVRMSM